MVKPKTTKTLECRFAVHCKSKYDDSDLHVVKEIRVDEDGIAHPQLRFLKDYMRPYWIVQKGQRNYTEQKEWYPLDGLVEYKATQTTLQKEIKRTLGLNYLKKGLRDIPENIFVFGSDVLSTALIKREYHKKYPILTPFSNAVGDTETDVVYGHGQIQMATISFKKKVFTVVQKDFVQGYANPVERIKELASLHIGDVIAKREIELEVLIADNEIEVVKAWFAKAHEWKPDFFSFWNMAFDINKVIKACSRANYDPAELFSDPNVPEAYKSFLFKEGPSKKITASGKLMSYKPSQRWHTVFAPASFYIVDAMSIYRTVRIGRPEEKSYALDYILFKHLGITKLKFVEAKKLKGLDWHRHMQKNYPLEYVVYNIFDCVSMEMLDEKIRDVELTMPMMARYSDFKNFNSQPQRAITDLHFYLLEKKNHVVAMTSGDMVSEMDAETVDTSNWIVMLPQELVVDNGLQCMTELGMLRTNLRAHSGDLDVSGAYPINGQALNISKATTSKELIEIEGLTKEEMKNQTINISGGRTNALEVAQYLFGLPSLDQWSQAFESYCQEN